MHKQPLNKFGSFNIIHSIVLSPYYINKWNNKLTTNKPVNVGLIKELIAMVKLCINDYNSKNDTQKHIFINKQGIYWHSENMPCNKQWLVIFDKHKG